MVPPVHAACLVPTDHLSIRTTSERASLRRAHDWLVTHVAYRGPPPPFFQNSKKKKKTTPSKHLKRTFSMVLIGHRDPSECTCPLVISLRGSSSCADPTKGRHENSRGPQGIFSIIIIGRPRLVASRLQYGSAVKGGVHWDAFSLWGSRQRWEYRTSEGWPVIGGEAQAKEMGPGGYIIISFFALIGGSAIKDVCDTVYFRLRPMSSCHLDPGQLTPLSIPRHPSHRASSIRHWFSGFPPIRRSITWQ